MELTTDTEPLLSAFRKYAEIYKDAYKKAPQGREFAELFVNSLNPADYKFYLTAAIHRLTPMFNAQSNYRVDYETHAQGLSAVDLPSSEEIKTSTKSGAIYSSKVSGINSMWQEYLKSKTIPTATGTKLLSLATLDDFIFHAVKLETHAESTTAHAVSVRKQIAVLNLYKVTAVADLPTVGQQAFKDAGVVPSYYAT